MPPNDTQNSLNALDTRDITLPRRLWSWLATQAKKTNQSVDEVLAQLIDKYRHPEVATPDLEDPNPPSGSARSDTHADEEQATRKERDRSSLSEEAARDERDEKVSSDASRPQGAPPPSANAATDQADDKKDERSDGGPDTYSAADRLRKASDRLQHLMRGDDSSKDAKESASEEETGTQIRELLKNNDRLRTLEPPEPTSKKDPDEGMSMFDMAADANKGESEGEDEPSDRS